MVVYYTPNIQEDDTVQKLLAKAHVPYEIYPMSTITAPVLTVDGVPLDYAHAIEYAERKLDEYNGQN